jgi:hypothetical protein
MSSKRISIAEGRVTFHLQLARLQPAIERFEHVGINLGKKIFDTKLIRKVMRSLPERF